MWRSTMPPKLSTRRSRSTTTTDTWLPEFRKQLLAWYRRTARDLPWRRTRDPYAIWVSEVMLQQTQVATVVAYFQRFMARWPTIAALAAAAESDVLRTWEGLGYYRRARQLHLAAKKMVAEHQGRFPQDPIEVDKLPGIGRYTAGAVLSIAFDARQPILEANTRRLLARLLALEGNLDQADHQQRLWQFAEELLPRRGSGTVNQALMELGSQVCTPRQARCAECPVAMFCPTRARGWQDRIPTPKVAPKIEACREVAAIVRHGNRLLLVQNQQATRWRGLWDVPCRQVAAGDDQDDHDLLQGWLAERFGIAAQSCAPWRMFRYSVTRFRITRSTFVVNVQRASRVAGGAAWHGLDRLADVPLNVTARRIVDALADEGDD
jgi:A/G-specific adenine glycosylase